ncbi:E4 [Betapapillomavirus 5]|uniref:E4 n=2 Tax=Papillomaviridae TaxID=151340 RepID=A0A2D2AL20_9PAPI|nr:E4 [Betapapillomavirus 5]AYA93703.1 MAG: E4 protein [Human papillomavirus]
MHKGLVHVASGKFVLTGKLCLLLSPAPRRPHSKKSENGPSPPTSPKQPPTPAPFNGKPDIPNGLNQPYQKGEGTNERSLALLPPPSGGGKKYQDILHGKKKVDGPEVPPRGDWAPTKPLQGDGDNDRPGPEQEAGAGAGAGAEAREGGEPQPNLGEGDVEGGATSHDPEVDLQNPDLLTNVAFYLHKWEQEYNLLVESILQGLRDYWQRLSTPQ